MARSSRLNIWQYITAILLILVLGFHLAERIPGLSPLGVESYEESLEAHKVETAYNKYSIILSILLITALFHGLNGLRGILLEYRQTSNWTLLVNIIIIVLFLGFLAFGFRTIYIHIASP